MIGFTYNKKGFKECIASSSAKNPKKESKLSKDAEWIKNNKITYSPMVFVNDVVIRVKKFNFSTISQTLLYKSYLLLIGIIDCG
jgi:hypothetical protein